MTTPFDYDRGPGAVPAGGRGGLDASATMLAGQPPPVIQADAAAGRVATPLEVTKRGALIRARR